MLNIKWKIQLFILLILCAIPSFAQNSATQDLASLLNDFNSMQANFTQTLVDSGGNVLQKSSGTMALQRPGKFRWDMQQPNQQLIIADGTYVWVYDVDLQQATRQPINQMNTANPASLLSGSVDALQNRFVVIRIPRAGGDWFSLKPVMKNDMFQSIEINFQNRQLKEMRIVDNLGQSSVLKFTQVQVNTSLSPSLFQFKPLKSVDVITQ